MKKNLCVSMILMAFSIFIFGAEAFGGRIYDDFSGTYIDGQKWEQREFVREVSGGKLISKIGGNIGSNGHILNQLGFDDPNSINTIKAMITYKTGIIDNSNTYVVAAQIEGFFYEDPSGSVWAGLSIGERGSGPEAWWDLVTDSGSHFGGTIPIAIQKDIEYSAKIEYNELSNQFTFTVAGVNQTYTGPARVGPSITEWKALTTGIWGDDSVGSGYTSATFDDVRINNRTTVYDNFSTSPLDPTKWTNWTLENVREISGGKLHLNVQADGSRRDATMEPKDKSTKYIEAKVLVVSGSQVSSGALGRARIAGFYYNESRGPGSGLPYDGYEGDVWVSNRIDLDDNNSLSVSCSIWRMDNPDPWGPGTSLFYQKFNTPIAFDTKYTLSIELRGSKFIFKCNNETYQYDVTTPMYVPSEGQYYRELKARVYADPGESGYMKTNFDDVCLTKPLNIAPTSILLLDE